jgi:hypothetical protein
MNALPITGTAETEKDTSNQNQHLVNGDKLLEIIFHEDCRPTVRWLRNQQKLRRIPFVKIGHLVFFSPAQVRAALEKRSQ